MAEMTRRELPVLLLAGACAMNASADEKPKDPQPSESPFVRDYPAPSFMPSWKKPKLPRELVQDFVIYAHSDLPMVQKLLAKEPALLNATVDWGAGDWETGLGGASHMGRRDIAMFLIESGARVDLFAAAMLGKLSIVMGMLELQPSLIDAKGPHGFSLHWHAKAGGKESESVLELLQKIKPVELPKGGPPMPPMKKSQ